MARDPSRERFLRFWPFVGEISGDDSAHWSGHYDENPSLAMGMTRLCVNLYTSTYEKLDPWELERFMVRVSSQRTGKQLVECPVSALDHPLPEVVPCTGGFRIEIFRQDNTPLTVIRGGAWTTMIRDIV